MLLKMNKLNCWMGEFCTYLRYRVVRDDQEERMNYEVSDAVVHLKPKPNKGLYNVFC